MWNFNKVKMKELNLVKSTQTRNARTQGNKIKFDLKEEWEGGGG